MSRTVTLVLVDADGRPLGALEPYEVGSPYWSEVADVVAGARTRHGVAVTVLRLLHTEQGRAMRDGLVTYLAQLDGGEPPVLRTVDVDLAPHPLRAPYAVPGGPARALAWAAGAMAALGMPPAAPAQHRTWNLSALWRLDGPAGPVWLKELPRFARHEAAVLRWLDGALPGAGPALLAADGAGRMLLGHVPGIDWYGADARGRAAIVDAQHAIQLRAVADVPALVAQGVPDRRGARLAAAIRAALAPYRPPVDEVLPDLDRRVAALAGCGLPETVVHGDLHPGNVRIDGDPATGARPVVIDWAEATVGHPALDLLRLTEDLAPHDARTLVRRWARLWRAARPGSDPERAVDLLRPVAALRNAATYAHFLAEIEPSEHPYHAGDVPFWLAEAGVVARGAPAVP
ncbi:aminoglycoside phosphotransferase family protein [Micromonospora sp. NPDC049559]|uniref:phosphotransferase family protein n=1 Tax=Micromonospora sp. NPDC049559 TaxID=3155923 RepID=UPI00342E69C6